MDTSSREAKAKWQAQQRILARAAFPLPDDQLQRLFDYVDAQLDLEPCDHTLRSTLGWLDDHGHSPTRTVDWLREHGGYCDCEVVANASDHWDQNRGLDVQVPDGWVVTYSDPSVAGDDREPKEDLLQLHHAGHNRIADLGWYIDHFRVRILQGDFNGELLAEVRVQDQQAALSALRSLLLRFSN
jgi:hypothetical protein